MEKDREKQYNGSYLYRLNQELSGRAELDPYIITSATVEGDNMTERDEEEEDDTLS
jgi:hypothetical protein